MSDDDCAELSRLFEKLLTCESARDIALLRVLRNDVLAETVDRRLTELGRLPPLDHMKAIICLLSLRGEQLQKQIVKLSAGQVGPIMMFRPPGMK